MLIRSYDPVPTPETQQFWTGTRQGELRIQRCRTCAVLLLSPATLSLLPVNRCRMGDGLGPRHSGVVCGRRDDADGTR